MKSLRSTSHGKAYGFIFLAGVAFACAGFAVFPTYSQFLGLLLVIFGVGVIMTGAIFADSCFTQVGASRQCSPPDYEMVMAQREDEDGDAALFLGPPPTPTRRHWSLHSPWSPLTEPTLFEMSAVNDPCIGHQLSTQLPQSECSERDRLQGRFVYPLKLPTALPPDSAANNLNSSAGESWKPEREAAACGPSLLPHVSFDGASPAHPVCVSCDPDELPSYDAVLAEDLRAGGVASPDSRSPRADNGRMTRGRLSAPELLGSPSSTGTTSLARADR